jgi:hypothetical protein
MINETKELITLFEFDCCLICKHYINDKCSITSFGEFMTDLTPCVKYEKDITKIK